MYSLGQVLEGHDHHFLLPHHLRRVEQKYPRLLLLRKCCLQQILKLCLLCILCFCHGFFFIAVMAPVPSPVLLEPISDAQLRGHTSNMASMLFGPNGRTEHILLPIGFELTFFLKLGKL